MNQNNETQYENTNKGILKPRADKTESFHGDFRGSIDIEGVEYWLDGYRREAADGFKFISLKAKRKVSLSGDDTDFI